MIYYFIFLALFFVVFLYGLLRTPPSAGETFLDMFKFWKWFDHDEQVRIGRLVFTLTSSTHWLGFFSSSHDGFDGFPPFRLVRLTALKKTLHIVFWR